MFFEWDPAKAEANFRKHGISFEEAKLAFLDANSMEWADAHEQEERTVLLGMCEGRILFIVYTDRPPNIRLISARKALRHEQDTYYKYNAAGGEDF